MILLLTSAALAQEAPAAACPWTKRIQSVWSDEDRVQIDGAQYEVVGRAAWEPFQGQLKACGMTDAADALVAWRKQRRTTNWSIVLGCATMGVGFITTPIAASSAGNRRERMEQAILGWSPPGGEDAAAGVPLARPALPGQGKLAAGFQGLAYGPVPEAPPLAACVDGEAEGMRWRCSHTLGTLEDVTVFFRVQDQLYTGFQLTVEGHQQCTDLLATLKGAYGPGDWANDWSTHSELDDRVWRDGAARGGFTYNQFMEQCWFDGFDAAVVAEADRRQGVRTAAAAATGL